MASIFYLYKGHLLILNNIISEQWPMRMCLLLHKIEDLYQSNDTNMIKEKQLWSICDFFDHEVAWCVYDTNRDYWPSALQDAFQHALILDSDPDNFGTFL
jgi:hypothetical protein